MNQESWLLFQLLEHLDAFAFRLRFAEQAVGFPVVQTFVIANTGGMNGYHLIGIATQGTADQFIGEHHHSASLFGPDLQNAWHQRSCNALHIHPGGWSGQNVTRFAPEDLRLLFIIAGDGYKHQHSCQQRQKSGWPVVRPMA